MYHYLTFIQKYAECKQYPNLINPGKIMASMFGSAYAYEQLFLSVKSSKSKLRTQLTNDHLQNVMLLASSNLPP